MFIDSNGLNGFSLVELSIVLVILGLLTGGILSGQSLIRAAELRAVSTEYQTYITSIQTFRDKYRAIPGDFRDATKFWGFQGTAAAPGCTSNSGITTVNTAGTCDGNGSSSFNNASGANQTGEEFHFWRQLAIAGLIEGTYNGVSGSSGSADSTIRTNVPGSKLSNAGWSISGPWVSTGNSATYAMDYGIFLTYGAQVTGNNATSGAILRPEEAWNIDTKLDDGRPAYGRVIARFWNNACAAADNGTHANNNLAASYKVSDNSLQCSLVFRNAF